MRFIIIIIVITIIFSFFPKPSLAIEDPTARPNNRFGIHILFPQELNEAAKLVNSNGGDWGYITIPIQTGDKDLTKWQKFMDDAKIHHLIPLVRLATEGDYFNTIVWRKPGASDVLDFANFLDSLNWPLKNRYIIIFNEPNRSDEWGGKANPNEYADILAYAAAVFKSKSEDYFIISAGFDNASVNVPGSSINEYDFMRQMILAVPSVYNQIDGISSHSYPNPGFSRPPSSTDLIGTSTFIHEKNFLYNLTGKSLPVFISETGWSKDRVSENLQSVYYKQTFSFVWQDSSIIAVTPFLLKAGTDPFRVFSFLDEDLPTPMYKAIRELPKVKGQPEQNNYKVLSAETKNLNDLPVKDFSKSSVGIKDEISLPHDLKSFVRWLLKI